MKTLKKFSIEYKPELNSYWCFIVDEVKMKQIFEEFTTEETAWNWLLKQGAIELGWTKLESFYS